MACLHHKKYMHSDLNDDDEPNLLQSEFGGNLICGMLAFTIAFIILRWLL
jgi:hypothetical protein